MSPSTASTSSDTPNLADSGSRSEGKASFRGSFQFDELARVPLVLGRARGALEGLLERFDETTVSQDDLWDPSKLRRGDVLTHRKDGRQYRIDRDDVFVRSLELVEAARSLQRLIILREDVPKLFLDPSPVDESGGRQ